MPPSANRVCNCTPEDLNKSDGYHWPGCPRFAFADSEWWREHPEKAEDLRTSFFRETHVRPLASDEILD